MHNSWAFPIATTLHLFSQMRRALQKSILHPSTRWDHLQIFLLLLWITFICRGPFLFDSVIDWDESTMILMGQSLLDGQLPYTQLWELKPPLAFVFYAGAIALFGKSIVAIRLAGLLWVTATGFLIYRMGHFLGRYRSQETPANRVGLFAAVLWIIASTLMPDGAAVMGEHVALLPLVAAVYWFAQQPTLPHSFFWMGSLVAAASMVRLNFAYVVLLGGFWAVLALPWKPFGRSLWRGVTYGLGASFTILLTWLPYGLSHQSQVWWSSVIVASLQRSQVKLSPVEVFWGQWGWMQHFLQSLKWIGFSLMFWGGAVLGLILLAWHWHKLNIHQKRSWSLVATFLIATEISILKSGVAYGHYLIQLVPFVALLTGLFLDVLWAGFSRFAKPLLVLFLLFVLLACGPVIDQAVALAGRGLQGKPLDDSAAAAIALYLQQNGAMGKPFYMMSDHLVYWYLDSQPLSPSTTHPSTIGKDYLLKILLGPEASSEAELRRILELEPQFIVKKEQGPWYLPEGTAARERLEETLQTQYEQVHTVQKRQIYRKLETGSVRPET